MAPDPGSDDEQLVNVRVPKKLVAGFDAAIAHANAAEGRRLNRSDQLRAYMAWFARVPGEKQLSRPTPSSDA